MSEKSEKLRTLYMQYPSGLSDTEAARHLEIGLPTLKYTRLQLGNSVKKVRTEKMHEHGIHTAFFTYVPTQDDIIYAELVLKAAKNSHSDIKE